MQGHRSSAARAHFEIHCVSPARTRRSGQGTRSLGSASDQRAIVAASPGISKTLEVIDESIRSFQRMMTQTVHLGRWGWLVPDEASLPDLAEILRKSTDPQSADLAFETFYIADSS